MDRVTEIIAWLNRPANALGHALHAPISTMPAWASLGLIGAVAGVVMLVIFKYTSNQRAIKKVRNGIKAELLALKLFKDNPSVMLRAQARLLKGAFLSFLLALVPMLVMTAPVVLLLSQLSLWYQWRPLRLGEEAILSLKLRVDDPSWPIQKDDRLVTWEEDAYALPWPDVALKPHEAIEVTAGPLRVVTQRVLYWTIRPVKEGEFRLALEVDGQTFEKQLVVGERLARVSVLRPSWNWLDVLLHPAEPPFKPDSAAQAIEINYPERSGRLTGAGVWVVYWFVASMIAAFVFRPLFNVTF